MLFNEYTHMENDYKILKYDLIQSILSDESLEFVAMEKIHGTNFSFITDGNEVYCCRRSDILKPEEKFYSYQTILSKYKSNIIKLFNEIKKINNSIIQIQLYGELYGGNYPGSITKSCYKTIQKGIYYSNSNEFAAFDLKYWTELDEKNHEYLNWIDFISLLNIVSIPIVPIILQGSWTNVSKLNPKFESIVYQIHNLPQIPLNYAEGYVIKPVKEIKFGKDSDRLIWKFKNPDFLEISKEKKPDEISNIIQNPFISKLETYVCEMRYDNVKTKVVEGTHVDKVIELFYNDVWVDFTNDLIFSNIELNEVDKKILEKKLKGFTNKFVRTRY
jgi:Rnl2 family RNA ligase